MAYGNHGMCATIMMESVWLRMMKRRTMTKDKILNEIQDGA